MNQVMNVCCVNFWAAFGEKELNRKRILEFIEAAKKRGADIVLFPEMSLTGYEYKLSSQDMQMNLAENVMGESVSMVAKLTQKLKIYACFGMPETDSTGNYYQSMIVCGPKGFIGSYRKIFLEGKEMFWAKNGHRIFEFDTEWGKIALGVTPGANDGGLTLAQMSDQVRLVLFPCATCNKKEKMIERVEMAKLLIKEGKVFVAFSNLTGKEMIDVHKGGSANVLGDLLACKYGGGSFVAGPSMHSDYEIFGGGIENTEVGMVMASVDLSHAKIEYNPKQIAEMRCSYV